jgi:hypothetical protein
MDYSVLNKTPDVAQAVVGHALDANGNAVPQSAGNPAPVAGSATARSNVTPTITSGAAYASGNAVGGLLAFGPGFVRVTGGGGVLQSAVLFDKSGNNVAYDLFLFDSAPAAPNDKTAYALGSDLAKAIGSVSFSGMVAAGTPGLINADGLGKAIKLGGGTTLYGILVTRGTPTYAGSADVTVTLVLLPD